MTKKATFLIISGLFLILLLGLSKFVRLPFFGVHPHEAIPSHMALFFKLQKNDLAQWGPKNSPLAAVFLPKNLRSDFDLFLKITDGKIKLAGDQPFLIGVQPSRSLGSDLLFVMPGGRGVRLNDLGAKNGWTSRRFSFKNQDIWTWQNGEEALSFTTYRNLLIFARHAYLVENAVSQLRHPSGSICRDPDFKKLNRRVDAGETGMPLFINLTNINAQFAPLLNAEKFSRLKKLDRVGEWLLWQLPLDQQASQSRGAFSPMAANSLTSASILANGHLEDYFFQAVPDNLSAFAALQTGNLKSQFQAGGWSENLAAWAGTWAVWAVGELLQKDRYEQFLLLPAKDGIMAEKALQKWSNGPATDYQFFKIWPLPASLFAEWDFPEIGFGVAMGDFVLFGNNLPGMERWLGKYMAGQTLSKDPAFLKLFGELPATKDGLFFLDGLKGWQIIAPFLNEQTYLSLDGNPLPFRALLVSLKWDGRVGELDFVVPKQAAEAAETANILWNVPLRNKVARSPLATVNPANGEMDVLVLDEDHRLYLISRNGRVLWQRDLGEPVLSDFFHIDLNNEKAGQFAFSTRHQIFVIDRQGENFSGWPLKLQVPATNGVTVVDFFQSHDYRFFIVCENGKAYGFDEKGSPVEGWRPKEGVGEVKYPMLHFQTEGKDFLALLEKNGKMQVFKKNGDPRFRSIAWDQSDLQPLDYQVSKLSSRIVTADPSGKVYVTNLAGDHFGLQLRAGNNTNVQFVFADVLGDERKDYVALSGADLTVSYYSGNSFSTTLKHEFPWPQDAVFPVRWARRQKDFIGTVNHSKKQLFLVDGNGKVPGLFPLAGSTPFVMVDLAGDGKPVLITGNGAAVTAYVLEK